MRPMTSGHSARWCDFAYLLLIPLLLVSCDRSDVPAGQEPPVVASHEQATTLATPTLQPLATPTLQPPSYPHASAPSYPYASAIHDGNGQGGASFPLQCHGRPKLA